MLNIFFKLVDWIDDRTVNVLPALSVEGMVAEAADVKGIPKDLQQKITLTQGRYKLTFLHQPPATLSFAFQPTILEAEGKQIRVVNMVYGHTGINRTWAPALTVTVDILENPLPLFAVVAVVLAFAISITALSTGSLLTKVEKVFITPTASLLCIVGIGGLTWWIVKRRKI